MNVLRLLRRIVPMGLQPAALPATPRPEPKPIFNGAFDQAPLTDLSILVVDDNPINLAVARAILEAIGAEISTAADGLEALELLRATTFDVVLMDLQMPRMDGSETIAQIRAGYGGPTNIPVIALSADVIGGENDAYLKLGFDAVQAKPIDAHALIGAIFDVLETVAVATAPEYRIRARPRPAPAG